MNATITTKKVLYIFDQSDWKSRLPVADLARAQHYEVTIALIGPKGEAHQGIPGYRTVFIDAPIGQMKGRDLPAMIKQIRNIIASEKPDLVHTVTLKYAFVTGLAALPYKTLRKIYTLAGLGYLFRSHDLKAKIIRLLVGRLLKIVLRAKHAHLIFQNPDDLALMMRQGFADSFASTLIRGSGVDLSRFIPQPEPSSEEPLVLMPTRLVREKGVHIFVEAARLLKASGVQARFQIAGGETQHNPKAISREEMLDLTKDGATTWLGRVEDMPALLSQAAIIVYPSYYGEGIPRVLLEACAAGRPIITTDHPGCREAVKENENGLLVPIKDIKATARAIQDLLQDSEKRTAMGNASRRKAEAEFDIKLIAQKTIAVYETVLS